MSHELIKTILEESIGQVDLDKPEETQRVQDANLEIAKKKDSNNPLLKSFKNESGVANLGHGSLASMLYQKKVDIHDLDGNLRAGTTQSSKEEDTRPKSDGIPTLRYINGNGSSIEIKLYMSGKIVASKTVDGINFTPLIESRDAKLVLMAISERALNIHPMDLGDFIQKGAEEQETFEREGLPSPSAKSGDASVSSLDQTKADDHVDPLGAKRKMEAEPDGKTTPVESSNNAKEETEDKA